jgi:hypothetical protein
VFLLYTIGMNAIPGAFAVAAAATHWRNDCDKNLALWLVVMAVVFNLFMIAFACRIHTQYNQPGSLGQGRRPRDTVDRCLHIFWWEPLVAAYFVLAPAAVAWSIIGLTWAAKSADAQHGGVSHECSRALIHMTRVSAIIIIVYLALSLAVGVFSCCCSCLTGAFRTGDEENLQYTGYQQDGTPPTRPQSQEPGAAIIGSLFHPQQQLRWGAQPSPQYEPLPGGNGDGDREAQQAHLFSTQPPPSGAQQQPDDAPSAPAMDRQGSPPTVPKLNLPTRKDA